MFSQFIGGESAARVFTYEVKGLMLTSALTLIVMSTQQVLGTMLFLISVILSTERLSAVLGSHA